MKYQAVHKVDICCTKQEIALLKQACEHVKRVNLLLQKMKAAL